MSALSGPLEARVFTDVQGRTLEAELVSVSEERIIVKLPNRKEVPIKIETLSEEDRDFVAEWAAEKESNEAERKAIEEAQMLAVEQRAKVVAFCESNLKQKVGNGECWTLADEAFKAAGAKRPAGESRVWGRLVNFEKEQIEPGDVVEFRTAAISGYGKTGPAHTSVVIEGGRRGRCKIAEQNWSGNKTVRTTEIDLGSLTSGEVFVYRIEATP
ncbi:hypothetical protein [Haloferula sp.]|uniref:hypothetical protein n=1 Tax=Haloferula sp. TaxID=2497595 RepID=UPI003C751CE1